MARSNKTKPTKKSSIQRGIKDAVKFTTEPPPEAITPPRESSRNGKSKRQGRK